MKHPHPVLAAQLQAVKAAGLPMPGETGSGWVTAFLPKPEVDPRTPDVRQQHKLQREVLQQHRARQREQLQALRRVQTAILRMASGQGEPSDGSACTVGRLDLQLVDAAVRRARVTAIARTHIHVRARTHLKEQPAC